MKKPASIKLIALDIDGVALPDSFSPVIYSFVKKWGGKYTRDIERNVFSQPRKDAANYLIRVLNLDIETDELLRLYFKEREEFLRKNPMKPHPGLEEFLKLIRTLGLKVVCYGGLDNSYFRKELSSVADFFDGEKYICTNEFRPGIREIVKKFYNLDYKNVLFIDDVNKVAEEAKSLNTPFIGVPSNWPYGFQRADMLQTGVKYLVSEIDEIDIDMIMNIDKDVCNNTLWKN